MVLLTFVMLENPIPGCLFLVASVPAPLKDTVRLPRPFTWCTKQTKIISTTMAGSIEKSSARSILLESALTWQAALGRLVTSLVRELVFMQMSPKSPSVEEELPLELPV